MPVHADTITSTGAGGVADTFDNVGTVELRSDATKVLGIWVNAVPVTATAAEAIHGQLRVTSSDLGVGAQIYNAPPRMGGAPATNIDFRTSLPEFIPFVYSEVQGKENIVIDYSTHLQDPTAANAVTATVVYETRGEGLPEELKMHWPYMAPITSGGDAEATGQVTALGPTAMTNLNIPAWAQAIIGFGQTIVPDLMTTAEEVIGFVQYTSTIPDFEPQEWPLLMAYGAPLATPVGKGAEAQIPFGYLGGYFPATGKNETITPSIALVAAVTTGHSVATGVQFTR